jgi:excisionase family DNA binding protein
VRRALLLLTRYGSAMFSVSAAADRSGLSVQRLRALIASGQLPAERVGHQWAIDEADLARHEPRLGRPLSPRSCWALLDLADGDERHLEAPSTSERARARRRLELLQGSGDAPRVLRSWLSARARRHVYRASPHDIGDLRSDSRLLISGVSHPESGISGAALAEGYLVEADVGDLVRDYLLVEASNQQGNVVLHVPSRPVSQVSQLLLAADLAEHRRPREDARAAELVRAR